MGSSIKRVQYRYDSVGNRVGMTDPDGGRFTYAYDSVNRISHMVNPQGDRTTYAYDPAGRRTVKKLANGTRASFSYDAAGNLTRLANLKSDGTTISSFDYDYDKVGNRTAVLEADGSRVTWSYDDTYQLTGEHRTGSNAYRDTYTYDPAGNRLLKIHDGARTSYSYDAANQLEWSEDASGRTTYTFDADGNQELVVEPSGDRTTTAWDYENRTTLVQLPSGIRNTMAYDPDGLRVKLEESTGTKKFVWDEQNYLAETDENDDTQVVYTNEPRLYGNLVSQRRGSESHWYHFDAVGSTRQLTDDSESITDTQLYDGWGVLLSDTGTTAFAFTFAGQHGYYRDSATSVLYVRSRILEPVISRWITCDPMGLAGNANLYEYVHNRPLHYIDPSGQIAVSMVKSTPAKPPTCGAYSRYFKMALAAPAPCDGYMVQRVSFLASVQYCYDVPFFGCCCSPADCTYVNYYEILGGLSEGLIPQGGTTNPYTAKNGHTDVRSQTTTWPGAITSFIVVSEVRFYCRDDVETGEWWESQPANDYSGNWESTFGTPQYLWNKDPKEAGNTTLIAGADCTCGRGQANTVVFANPSKVPFLMFSFEDLTELLEEMADTCERSS